MSPSTISQPISVTLVRGLVGRRSARTSKPRATRARATAEPTNPDAPVTTTRSAISSGVGFGCAQEFAGDPHHARHEHRAQQALVVNAQAAIDFGETDVHQLRDGDIFADLLGAEVMVKLLSCAAAAPTYAGDADAFPN